VLISRLFATKFFHPRDLCNVTRGPKPNIRSYFSTTSFALSPEFLASSPACPATSFVFKTPSSAFFLCRLIQPNSISPLTRRISLYLPIRHRSQRTVVAKGLIQVGALLPKKFPSFPRAAHPQFADAGTLKKHYVVRLVERVPLGPSRQAVVVRCV
jgi:hypothetical protein